MAYQSSKQLHSPDQSTTWRGIGRAVVLDALATNFANRLNDDPGRLKDPRAKGPLVDWCGGSPAGQSAAPEWRPLGQCPDGTRQVCKEGRRPKNCAGDKISKTLFLPAPSCCLLAGLVLCLSCFLLCGVCAAFPWFLSVGADLRTGLLCCRYPLRCFGILVSCIKSHASAGHLVVCRDG